MKQCNADASAVGEVVSQRQRAGSAVSKGIPECVNLQRGRVMRTAFDHHTTTDAETCFSSIPADRVPRGPQVSDVKVVVTPKNF